MQDGDVVFAIQKERITRKKHHWGKLGDVSNFYSPLLWDFPEPIDLVVECYSSDDEFANLKAYEVELRTALHLRDDAEIIQIPHHLAHLYSAAPVSGFDQSAVMVIDFMGSPVRHLETIWERPASTREDDVEVASYYTWGPGGPRCEFKHLWNRAQENGLGLGYFYQSLAQSMFPGEGTEGKAMGLAAFGDPYAMTLPGLPVDEGRVTIPDAWIEAFEQAPRFAARSPDDRGFQECANFAAAGQKAFEEALLDLAGWLKQSTGRSNLCFAGGAALNCVANGRLRRESAFGQIYVPPAPNDAGTAIGCAMFGALQQTVTRRARFRWKSDFLGPDIVLDPNTLDDDLAAQLTWQRPEDAVGALADLLCTGKAIGVIQKGAEFGPRALGHRSILANPMDRDMKDWINKNIKGREWFRPLAPMVLEADAGSYFEIDGPSPYMLYTFGMKPQSSEVLPAINHADSSARLQTVGPQDDPLIYELLCAMKRRTGHGVLLNTSFNGQDEPIVESLKQALTCLIESKLAYVYAPPFLYSDAAQE